MIVFSDDNIVFLKEILSNYCEFHQFNGRKLNNNDLINSKCEILFTRSQTKVNSDLLNNSSVKLVATATSGTDHFDLEYLKKSNLEHYDAKGSNANSVAEYVIFSILYWNNLFNLDTKNQTIGIVGFGSIGQIVANYAFQLGMKVLINDPPLKNQNYNFPEIYHYADLDSLISNSDILTNHIPLSFEGEYPSCNLFNMKNMINFKKNGLIIHSSRGKVFDENTLEYLNLEKKASLIIDVWENEPDFNINLATKTLIASPHIAGHSHNGKLLGTLKIIEIFEKYSSIEVDKKLIYDELSRNSLFSINDFKNQFHLMNSINERRKILDDNDIFKKIISLDNKDKIIEFDNLRKNYPIRYELLSPFI